MELMDKTKLFKSEFYRGLEQTLRDWDEALGKNHEDAFVMRRLSWCLAQWEVYRKALKFICGTEYKFVRTDECFGACSVDGKDWLLYVEREPATCRCIQKVKEYGIKCNEVEYYNEDFVKLYLGQDVRVIETEKTVKVRDMEGNKIIHFPKLPVEKVKGMFKGFTPESIRVATEATQSLVEFGTDEEQKPEHIQKVTRKGIKAEGKRFWSDELTSLHLGKEVNVTTSKDSVYVMSMQGILLAMFDKSKGEPDEEQPVPAGEITPTPSMRKVMQELESAQESVWNPQNREALRKALWETLEMVLESELFTRAARRGLEDYEFVVSGNISTMVDSVLGRYERILHKVRD